MTRVLLILLFLVLLAADTLGMNPSLGPGLSVKNAFLYLIVLGVIIDTALKRNRRIELLPVIVPYALCAFYAACTVLIIVLLIDYSRYDLLRSIISLKARFADNILVLLIFFYGISTAKDALSTMKIMVWIVMFANVASVLDAFNLPDLGLIDERADGRIGGPIGESNQYAAFLALFLPASVALVLIERGTIRVLAILGVAASLVALLMTASRGGLLGVLGGAAIGVIFLRKFISGKDVAVAIVLIPLFFIAAVGITYFSGYGDLLYDRFIGASSGSNVSSLSSGRTWIWATAISKMFENSVSLVTGYGWDTYSQLRFFRFAPHNSYLKIFFELGMIGLFLVLLAFGNVLRTARNGIIHGESETATMLFAFIFGLSSILVAIFFVDIASPWIFMWAYVGTAMRLSVMQHGMEIKSASSSSNSSGERHGTSKQIGPV